MRMLLPLAGFMLISAAPASRLVSIDLPFDATPFADMGPAASADAMNNNCLSCHSGEMIRNQPALSRAEWAAEVAKMRAVYKAPVAEADDAAIIDWLTAMSAGKPGG